MLTPLIPSFYSTKDSFTFVEEIKKVRHSNSFIVSYDVCSLFTNIPLAETIELAVKLILETTPDIKISKKDLTKLFYFATAQTHFIFKGQYYDQVDGVAMGSPLAPVLANLFMGHHEAIWLNGYTGCKPLFYKRYVDDIISIFNTEEDSLNFLDYLNTRHPNIRFTMEKQIKNKISFLDVHLENLNSLITSVFRKSTFTGILTNFHSYTSFIYKKSLINCLIDRAFKINNTWLGFHKDLQEIKNILKKNSYPLPLINENIKKRLQTLHSNHSTKQKSQDVHYFKLPFLGKQSDNLNKKISSLCKKYCKSVPIRIVFVSTKIRSFFSSKDSIPKSLMSNVVYKFQCARCNSCYIGETTRHLEKRIVEHLRKDKTSAIYKHIHEDVDCFNYCDKSCFSILDTAMTNFQLKVKEGMYIGWENPNLNKQVKYVQCTLTV